MRFFGESIPCGVDLDGLREEWTASGLLDVMDEIVETFIEDTRDQLAILRGLAQAGDCDKASKIGHSLRSSAGSLRATRLAELCKDIEFAGRAGDTESVRALVASASAEFAIVRTDLSFGLAA